MNIAHRLLQFVKPYKWTMVISMVLLIFAGLFEILTISLVIPLFDQVLTDGQSVTAEQSAGKQAFLLLHQRSLSLLPGSIITQLASAMVILTTFKGVFLYYSNYLMSCVGQNVLADLRIKLFSHVISQSISFFSLNSTGRLMSRMGSDVEQLQEAVSTSLAEVFREIILLVALLLFIFFLDWKLALIALLIAPLVLLLTIVMGKRIRAVSLKGREEAATLFDRLQQSITGIRIIKAFGMEAHEEQGFRQNSIRLKRRNIKAVAVLFLNSPVMELLAVLAFIPVLYYAHMRIVDGSLTLGLFGGSIFTLFRMYDPIRKLSRLHVLFQRALASGSRIVELLDMEFKIEDRPNAGEFIDVRSSIEFRNVCFKYPDESGDARVLEDINVKVEKNHVVALVGSSGAGKTTLAGLLPRFYDPISGAVLIDGVDIREYSQHSLRKKIAIVTQDTFLFNDTVRNNIAYGDISAPDERLIAAARAALADNFINSFPMKYDTVIGERGQRLSGGERQRLSIARALLKNAPILILDEATSALDSESEKLVQEALANLMQDRTTFVIAHRLSTIRNADMILVLDHGRIIESGTHESLMQKRGHYHRFFKMQMEETVSMN
jgi:ATP-binding cassette, subfamily B, bacterial MsbA